jgi:hypothetical protein
MKGSSSASRCVWSHLGPLERDVHAASVALQEWADKHHEQERTRRWDLALAYVQLLDVAAEKDEGPSAKRKEAN